MKIGGLKRGLSIGELIVGMVILAIIGMALSRVLVSQARYFSHQKASNLARNVSRGPLNRVVSDLRMVEALGAKVLKLVRTRIGEIAIGDLEIGKYRPLTAREVRSLYINR